MNVDVERHRALFTSRDRQEIKKKKKKRERERGLASTCCTPFVLLVFRCPHGTTLLDMVGMDHMAVGMDVDVAAGVESRMYAPMSNGSVRSVVLGTGGVVRTADTVRVSGATTWISSSRQLKKKIAVLEKTLAGMGDDEPILVGTEVLEKELDKLQRKLNGPKKTAKHIEAKQNWINRESKRLKAETARLAELQESLRVRKETLKVAYEEIKILREDLLREGETMDKNKSHFLSLENTEQIRRLEQQELAFWRGSASKRLAGWTRHGSAEEIAGWTMEAQRLNKEVEAKKRKLQETIVRESRKDARMEDAMDDVEGSLSS